MLKNCPVCNAVIDFEPEKSWAFEKYNVERYKCNGCATSVNFYFEDDKLAYTIPKRK